MFSLLSLTLYRLELINIFLLGCW